jgi:hypothetical protein
MPASRNVDTIRRRLIYAYFEEGFQRPILKGEPNLVLSIQKYQITNYRASGFTPWVAYHSFRGELKSGNHYYLVRGYFLYGKVPVWSMSEVHEPCLSMPMTILITANLLR